MSWKRKDWLLKLGLPAAAIAGAAFTGGGSLGLLGAAEGAAGAAGAEGLGLLGMGGASAFGPASGTLGATMLGESLAPAATPLFTGGAGLLGPASAFGPSAEGAGMLAALDGPGANLGGGMSLADKMAKVQKLMQLTQSQQQQKQPMAAPAGQRPQQQAQGDALEARRKIYQLMNYGGNYYV